MIVFAYRVHIPKSMFNNQGVTLFKDVDAVALEKSGRMNFFIKDGKKNNGTGNRT